MSDAAFAARVEATQGRVMIGLKLPAALEGVDNSGRVLATVEQVRPGLAQLRALGVEVNYEFKRTPVVSAVVSGAVAAVLRRNPWVDYVEPAITGNLSSQVTPWGISRMGAASSWGLSTGSGVKVLVMDSGLDSAAVDVFPVTHARCLGTYDSRYYDWAATGLSSTGGHGTHVAGIIAAQNNAIDVVGGAHEIELWMANISHDIPIGGGYYKRVVDFGEAACNVELARLDGIRVVNMSFNGSADSTSTALTDQINGAFNYDNILFVASVGNGGGSVQYPATLSNVIAVTATDSASNGHPTWANTGSQVDLSAPGVGVLSTWMPGAGGCSTYGGGYLAVCDGTSQAAPHVTAAAALLIARYPSWSNAQVRDRLLATATDLGSYGLDATYGYGLVNVLEALQIQVEVVGPSGVVEGVEQEWGWRSMVDRRHSRMSGS